MKKFYICFFLFAFITTTSRSQGVSSGYIIDSVVIRENYDGWRVPQSQYGTMIVDSFDTYGQIRSSYHTFRAYYNYPTYRIIYKYSNSNKLLKELREDFVLNRWRKSSDDIYVYDEFDRKIEYSRNWYNYFNLNNPDSISYSNSDKEFYEYNNQNLLTKYERRNSENGIDINGSRQTKTYDNIGRRAEIKFEQWTAQNGYRLYLLYRYEYNSNDSVKAWYQQQYYLNSPSVISKREYTYNNWGYLSETVNMLLDSLNQSFYSYPGKFYYYDSLNRRIKIEVIHDYKALYKFNSNGLLEWSAEYDWNDEDSLWFHTDSNYITYNQQNQMLSYYTEYYGISNFEYDSSGFNNYYTFTGNNDDGTVYISYKKLLHPNAIPDENSFTLFPNPNDGNFSLIYFSSIDEPITIKVHNALGQLVFQETENKTAGYFREHFSLGKVSNGIYYLEFTSSSKRTTKKILVE